MQFLADESCDFAIVRALRQAGHDVSAEAETARSSADESVLGLSVAKNRILLTEDKISGNGSMLTIVQPPASFFCDILYPLV